MLDNYLWSPSDLNTNLNDYINYLKKINLHTYSNYDSLHNWSIKNKDLFWKSIWDFAKIKGDFKSPIVENEHNFINSKFFNNTRINYTSNIIIKNDNSDALVFYSEQKISR